MAVKIRLTRLGKKNRPSFRIVATDSRSPRDGKALEVLGHFNPSEKPPKFSYKKERVDYWLSVGAKMTKAVEALIEGNYEYKPYSPRGGEKPEASEEGVKEEIAKKEEVKEEEAEEKRLEKNETAT